MSSVSKLVRRPSVVVAVCIVVVLSLLVAGFTVITSSTETAFNASPTSIMMVVNESPTRPIAGDGPNGQIEVIKYSHNVYSPSVAQQGAMSGGTKHSPIIITKAIDKSSPRLFSVCSNGIVMQNVTFLFFFTNQAAQSQHYYTITLEDVLVTSYMTFMPNERLSNTFGTHMEEVAFVYHKITMMHVITGETTEETVP